MLRKFTPTDSHSQKFDFLGARSHGLEHSSATTLLLASRFDAVIKPCPYTFIVVETCSVPHQFLLHASMGAAVLSSSQERYVWRNVCQPTPPY